MQWPSRTDWLAVLGVALLYFAAARLGLLLAFEGSNASPVWPPSGLAVAAVVLRGRRMLLSVALGAFSANATVFAANGTALATLLGASAGITAGNCLEAAFGARLLQRWIGKASFFERLNDVAKFVVVAALASAASAAVGTTTLVASGIIPAAAVATVSLTWWIGDASGVLVITPLLLALLQRPAQPQPWRARAGVALLLAALALLGCAVFAFPDGSMLADRRAAWLFMPVIAWAAYRHGPLGVAGVSMLTAALAVWGTTRGWGPFVRGNLNDALIVLQTFVVLTAITGLVLAADRRERQYLGRQGAVRRDLAVPWAVLLGSVGVTMLAWNATASDTERRALERFKYLAAEVHDRIRNTMRANEQVLRGAAGLFAASAEVTREEWRAYVGRLELDRNFPGIQALGFARMLEGGASAIAYIEPFDRRNRRAFGFDMLSEPVRRAAMERARDTGESALSGKVTLLQEDGQDVQAGTLLYQPIFRNDAPVATVTQRRAALLGFAYTPLRMNNLIGSALGQLAETEGLAIRVYSGPVAAHEGLLFDGVAPGQHWMKPFLVDRPIELPGGEWALQVMGTPRFEAAIDLQKAQIVLIAGVGLSLLLFGLVRTLTMTRERALMLADDMNAAVKDSQAQFRSLAESASEAIVIADAQGRICSWNRAAQTIFGHTEQQVLGQDLTCLMPARYREGHRAGLARLQAGGPAHVVGSTVQLEGQRSDGSVFPIELSLASWESAGGRFFSGIIRDITDRERAAQALRQSEQTARAAEVQLQAVLRASPLGIIFTDAQGQLLYGNPTYLRIARLTLDQAQGAGWAHAIHPEDLAEVSEKWLHAVSEGSSMTHEFRYRYPDGTITWARAISAAVVEDGKTQGFVAVVEDITARITADAELAAKTAALERSNEELAQFAYVASHDLKEPLRTVASYSQLLLRRHGSQLDAQALEFVQLIGDGARRAQALVSDLLSLARLDSVGGPIQAVAMQDVLDDARRQLSAALESAGAKLTQDPLPTVLGDRAQLSQLMQNLIENAIKFRRPAEDIEVHISARPEGEGFWRLSVRDNGIGIDPRFHEQIFTIFKRLHRADIPGTGIGLAICKKVIERHGGRIGVESNAGHGSTFFFIIAAVEADGNEHPARRR